MRQILLRTRHACAGPQCRLCRLVENALRRALEQRGHPMPEHVPGRTNQEGHVSGGLAVAIEHKCETGEAGAGPLDAPTHLELHIDGVPHALPGTVSPQRLERFFLGLLQEQREQESSAPR